MLTMRAELPTHLLQKFISHLLSLLTFLTNTLFISMLYVFTEWRQWQKNNFTADRLQAHLPWVNARLCFILKYILLRQALYQGLWCLFRKLIFRNNNTASIRITDYFYPIIILNVIRTGPWHHGCTPSTPFVSALSTLTGKSQCVCKW